MVIFVTILSLLVSLTVGSTDETLVEKAFGTEVVKATLTKIQSICFFENDHYFFRRLAYVETTDGNDDDTFAEGFYGGIWKIDQRQFNKTKLLGIGVYYIIKENFNIDWPTVQWRDLLKPFYSGLAAYLYVEYLIERGRKLPIDIEAQSRYRDFNLGKAGEHGKFLLKAKKLEHVMCDESASDIIFVADGSGSVAYKDFELQKEFIINFMKGFKVGPFSEIHTRFSFLQFGYTIREEFIFNTYDKHSDYELAIEYIDQLGGGIPTHFVLDHVANVAFKENRGARKHAASRIAIIFTDGASDDLSSTKISAQKLLEKDIVVFVVGIGSKVNRNELKSIASDPHCLYTDHVASFKDLEQIRSNIVSRVCRASV